METIPSQAPDLPPRPKRVDGESSPTDATFPLRQENAHLGLPKDLRVEIRRKPVPAQDFNSPQTTGSENQLNDNKPAESKPDLPLRHLEYENLKPADVSGNRLGSEDGSELESPPPYDEDDLRRAQEDHDRALDELDLNAGGETLASPDFDAESDDNNDSESPVSDKPSSRTATFKSIYSQAAPKVKTAYNTTRHFAGGLISHPVQSTKHFSILRHSHGLVAYRGHRTNVAITLFADDPSQVPSDRTIWLQSRGWTGNRGMAIKTALGRTKLWTDVTPQAYISADQVKPTDEKAWQRDISQFLRKAGQQDKFARRMVVQTCIVRVPVITTDGYFRLMVCDARKKVLCPSPVFRVASLSTSSASFRGASLRTMPLELGIKALSTFASNAASSGTAPIVSVINNRLGTIGSSVLSYGASDAATKAENAYTTRSPDEYEEVRGDTVPRAETEPEAKPAVVGPASGPEAPYPVQFSGKVVRGVGKSNIETGLPTANLSGVRDEIKTRLSGIYFAWASIQQSKSIASETWRPALIFARPADGVPGVAPKKILRAYIIEDFDGVEFYDAKLSVLVMGFVRDWDDAYLEQLHEEATVDALLAKQSLERPAWQAEATLKLMRSQTSLSDKFSDTRKLGQRQIDRIPFETFSIRMSTAKLKDSVLGKGGLCIDRRAAG